MRGLGLKSARAGGRGIGHDIGRSERRQCDILVIGGGPVGVCCACALAQAGAEVTLIECGAAVCPPESAAHGNCGLLTPSEVIPLAAPGVVAQGLRSMLKSTSSFRVTPRLSPALARWLLLFRAAAETQRTRARMPALAELHWASAALHDELAAVAGERYRHRRRGLLEVCETLAGLAGVDDEVYEARQVGVRAEELSPAAVRERYPGLRCSVAGAYFFPDDSHVDPCRFTQTVAELAAAAGATVLGGVEALTFTTVRPSGATVLTTAGEITAGQVVVAAGVWAPRLLRGLGLRLPIQAAKGYSIDYPAVNGFGETPVLMLEEGAVLTPLGDGLRVGGVLELSGTDMTVSPRRVAHMQGVAARAAGVPAATPMRRVWRDPRPLSPDGLPFIGRVPAWPNVIVAGGHSMHGLTLGPASGRLVAELAGGGRPAQDLTPFAPARFG